MLRNHLLERFWETFLGQPKAKTTVDANIIPSPRRWMRARSSVGGCHFHFFIKQTEGRVELYIYGGPGKAEENKRTFDWLRKRKAEVEHTFGDHLSWQRLDDKQACRISHVTNVGGYRSDESKWPAIQDAMIDAMGRLEKALAPQLEKLNTELASHGG